MCNALGPKHVRFHAASSIGSQPLGGRDSFIATQQQTRKGAVCIVHQHLLGIRCKCGPVNPGARSQLPTIRYDRWYHGVPWGTMGNMGYHEVP